MYCHAHKTATLTPIQQTVPPQILRYPDIPGQDLDPLLRNELLFRGSVDFVNADVSGLGTFKHLGKTESCVRLMDLFNPSR